MGANRRRSRHLRREIFIFLLCKPLALRRRASHTFELKRSRLLCRSRYYLALLTRTEIFWIFVLMHFRVFFADLLFGTFFLMLSHTYYYGTKLSVNLIYS